MKVDAFEADRDVFRYAKGTSEIQVSLHRYLDAFGRYAHCRGHHLAGDLRTSCQSPKQKVTGTGAGTGAPNSLVRLGLVDGTSDIDGARHRNIGLSPFRTNFDFRGIWVITVLFFQRLLKRSNIHGDLLLLYHSANTRGPRHFGRAVLKPIHLHASIGARQGAPMPKFVIEREVPGAGDLTEAQLREISQKSVSVLKGMGPQIQWLHSYVTGDKVYCVYLAPDEASIQEHARRVGLPANRVSAVRRLIDPTMAG
jgi:Protein of unknown function (DUF4242)